MKMICACIPDCIGRGEGLNLVCGKMGLRGVWNCEPAHRNRKDRMDMMKSELDASPTSY